VIVDREVLHAARLDRHATSLCGASDAKIRTPASAPALRCHDTRQTLARNGVS
jgi:hypothetical protein